MFILWGHAQTHVKQGAWKQEAERKMRFKWLSKDQFFHSSVVNTKLDNKVRL